MLEALFSALATILSGPSLFFLIFCVIFFVMQENLCLDIFRLFNMYFFSLPKFNNLNISHSLFDNKFL